MYTATIRHHVIGTAIRLCGHSLRDTKRQASLAVRDGFPHDIVIIDNRTGAIVARRGVSESRWTNIG